LKISTVVIVNKIPLLWRGDSTKGRRRGGSRYNDKNFKTATISNHPVKNSHEFSPPSKGGEFPKVTNFYALVAGIF